MVIETSASQLFIVQLKTQGLNQMQRGTGRGAQAYDVAGIGRDLWLEQHYFKHG